MSMKKRQKEKEISVTGWFVQFLAIYNDENLTKNIKSVPNLFQDFVKY